MSNTFKPGDRVRRTTTHATGLYPTGYEFTVGKVLGRSVHQEGENYYAHAAENLELVAPAPIEFQKGDRVRAMAKKGDDSAEFIVKVPHTSYVLSEAHTFYSDEWDFELLARPEPPKPWENAEEGDVWVLEFKGQILSPEAYAFADGKFSPTNGRRWSVSPLDTTILSARKLWPEN